jgi:hypothetical protein
VVPLTEGVGHIVRGGLTPSVEAVTEAARERMPAKQLGDFVTALKRLGEPSRKEFFGLRAVLHLYSKIPRLTIQGFAKRLQG